MSEHKGSCLCGAVAYMVNGPLRDVTYCHCNQCRKTSGHFFAATACEKSDLEFITDRGLKWFRTSETASRGFCGECGSVLFWKPNTKGHISILAGSIDNPTHLKAKEHIFVQDKGDYYEITDDLPQHQDGASY